MRKPKKNIVVAAGLTCLLAVGTCGCSSSSESTTTIETSVTDEDGKTTTNKTEMTSSTEDGTSVSTGTDVVINIDDWTDSWMGTCTSGQEIYYAQSPDASQGVFVIHDAETGEILSMVGASEVPQEGTVIVTDAVSDNSVTFTVIEQDDSGVSIDLGEEYGTADLDAVDINDFISAIQEFDVDGQVFA